MTLACVDASKGKRRRRRVDDCPIIGALEKKPMAFSRFERRDDRVPTPTYRPIGSLLDARLRARAACKLMVGALALAAERDCAQSLGPSRLQALLAGALPSLVELQPRFGAAIGHGVGAQGNRARFLGAPHLMQQLQVAKQALRLIETIGRLDKFALRILEDIGDVKKKRAEDPYAL